MQNYPNFEVSQKRGECRLQTRRMQAANGTNLSFKHRECKLKTRRISVESDYRPIEGAEEHHSTARTVSRVSATRNFTFLPSNDIPYRRSGSSW